MLPDRRLNSFLLRPGHQHHRRGHHLSILLVGGPERDGLGDGRVRQQRSVDLDGRDLLAAAVDQLFEAASEGDVPFLVEEALVSL